MEKLISAETLYELITKDDFDKTETKKSSKLYHEFYDTYIEPAYKNDYANGGTMDDLYQDVVFGYHKDGFIAGFKAAINLLLDVA